MINNVLKNIALSCSLTVMSMSLTASDVPIEQYLAPLDIRLSLDTIFKDAEFKQAFFTKNKQKLAALGCTIYDTHWGNVVVEHKNLPGYLIKGEKPLQNRNWKRVLYGQEIRDAIGNNSSFLVATEYLYQYPGHQDTLHSNNYCVISEKIPLQDVPLTTFLIDKPELIEDIQRIMKIVGYWDPGINANICVTTDDKIAFIDTEPYPDDHNFIVQPVLDLLFFRLQKRGEVTANKLQLMVEQAKNPHLYKKQSIFKTAGKYALYSLALYTAIKIVKNKIA